MSKSDGGLAFPFHTPGGQNVHLGMSLRDYFAAAALTGPLSQWRDAGSPEIQQRAAEAAYKFADAMLKARNQK